ncbi:SPFH domain-containing protein [Ferrovibrio terrae]|uniref:SPFH domain-containing protein n=1 Tax=Ferrovibrio terrae TaxID=2594003 RepID=UPI0031376EFB
MDISPATIVLVVLAILVVVTILAGVKTVSQGQQWTVERFGRYTRTLTPGIHLIIPYIEQVGHKISVMEIVLEIPEQEVITKDNATVTADGIVFYQILDVVKAAYEVQNLTIALSTLAMTNVRAVIGAMDLDEALSQRDQINRRLLSVIDQATSPWGVKVTRIELRNIQPPQNLLDAMGKQMTAERSKRAEILAAEGEKQAAILRAEGQKQAAVLEAEGRRDAAQRDAEARERLAEAEARATKSVSDAISGGNIAAINYFVAQKYIEAFAKLAESPNQKMIMMPMEATGIVASLAGIAELAKEAQGRATTAVPPKPWGEPKA